MSREDLARRLSISRQAVLKIERAEVDGAVTLAKLREVADALGCDVYYALVPRQSLEDIVGARARALAEQQVSRVEHTMRLEDQLSPRPDRDELIDELAQEISRSRTLWRS